MRRFPIRFYLIPMALAVLMILSSFRWWALAAVTLASASGFHIGMQHYGLMRLLDRKMGLARLTPSLLTAEKFLFITGAMLPTTVFSLKILRAWSPATAAAAIVIALIALIGLAILSFRQYRNMPPARLVALWSFALAATPWAFFYRFDYNELAFLAAGLGHSVQYFVCFRLYLSGKRNGDFGIRPDLKSLRRYYGALVFLFFAVEWAAFENIHRNFLTSFIWALSAVHIYYDSLFWKNSQPHLKTHVMAPLYAAVDRIRIK